MEVRYAVKQDSSVPSDMSETSATHGLLSLLPAIVQRRVVPRLRYSLKQALAQDHVEPCRPPTPGHGIVESFTPPPSYRSSSFDDASPRFSVPFQDAPFPSRPSTSGTVTPSPPYEEESDSGINWRYAEPGFSLVTLAQQEESTPAGDACFTRRQYIAGVSCMLRGLPSELSPEEIVTLRGTLPPVLLPAAGAGEQALMQRDARRARAISTAAGLPQRSTLHRLVATATLYLFLAISIIVPYVQILLKEAYQYDRRHKISDRVLAQGLSAADSVGKGTLAVASNVCAMNDGMVGEAMKEVGTYLMQGFGGGVYDGLGEGMQLLGLRAAAGVDGIAVRRVKSRSIA